MHDIFLSYAREDRDKAEKLVAVFEAIGWKVWMDREIQVGRAFPSEIRERLEGSTCVVAVLSAAALESKWVMREATWAADNERLLPVLLEDVAMPFEFREVNAANLTSWNGVSSEHPGLSALVDALGHRLGTTAPELPARRFCVRCGEELNPQSNMPLRLFEVGLTHSYCSDDVTMDTCRCGRCGQPINGIDPGRVAYGTMTHLRCLHRPDEGLGALSPPDQPSAALWSELWVDRIVMLGSAGGHPPPFASEVDPGSLDQAVIRAFLDQSAELERDGRQNHPLPPAPGPMALTSDLTSSDLLNEAKESPWILGQAVLVLQNEDPLIRIDIGDEVASPVSWPDSEPIEQELYFGDNDWWRVRVSLIHSDPGAPRGVRELPVGFLTPGLAEVWRARVQEAGLPEGMRVLVDAEIRSASDRQAQGDQRFGVWLDLRPD